MGLYLLMNRPRSSSSVYKVYVRRWIIISIWVVILGANVGITAGRNIGYKRYLKWEVFVGIMEKINTCRNNEGVQRADESKWAEIVRCLERNNEKLEKMEDMEKVWWKEREVEITCRWSDELFRGNLVSGMERRIYEGWGEMGKYI